MSYKIRISIFILIAAFYLAIPNARPDFTRFNCHDGESYVALAYNLAHGRGYTRALPPDPYLPHTTWPPGTAALLVPALAPAGATVDWLPVKWTMSLVGLSGVVLTWYYLRRLTGGATVADVGALAVAANPYYWDFSHQAMAEVPMTVWLIGGLLLVDRVWSCRPVRAWEAAASGFVCGVGMLFKGHAAGLMLVPLLYLAGRRTRTASVLAGLARWLVYVGGFAAPQLLWMLRNRGVIADGFEGLNRFRSILAVNPNDPASGLMTLHEVGATVVHNLRHSVAYVLPSQVLPGLWPERVWDWKGSGPGAIALAVVVLALAIPRRFGAWPACVVAAAMAMLNVVYAFGGNARFWMPVTTMLTIAIVANHGPRLIGLRPRAKAAALATIAILLALNLIAYVIYHEAHPYEEKQSWGQLARLMDEIARRDDLHPTAVVTQYGNSLALRLITGYPAPMPRLGTPYSHVITLSPDASKLGGRVVHSAEPWQMIELPRPMRWEEIRESIPLEDDQYAPPRPS